MPKVPLYDGPTVRLSGGSNARVEQNVAPAVAGKDMQELGGALMSAGSDAGRIYADMARQANETRVNEALDQTIGVSDQLQVEYSKLQGKNALEPIDGKNPVDKFGEQLDEHIKKTREGLSNDAQRRSYDERSMQMRTRFDTSLMSHQVKQNQKYTEDTYVAGIANASNRGALLWGDPGVLQESQARIVEGVDGLARLNGWGKPGDAIYDQRMKDALGPYHGGVSMAMIRGGRADLAQSYYDAHSAEMSDQSRAQVLGQLQPAIVAQKGEAAADEAWGAVGPQGPNDPTKLADVEKYIRTAYGNDPEVVRHAIAGVRDRSQAFEYQQKEVIATNVNGVWAQVDGGKSLAEIKRSEAWLSLPAKEQHDLEGQIRNDRADRTEDELSRLKRGEALSYYRNAGDYATASDPDVLSKMSRAQVEALRGKFGTDMTLQLLGKWEQLQKPGKVGEARIDKQDFDAVADTLGLHPFDPSLSESQKRELGVLQFRVEQLIDQRQQAEKKPMTRDEKMSLMRNEMARTVTVAGTFRDKTVPVIGMKADQVPDVVVPDSDRSEIVRVMQARYAQSPGDPAYAPTEENVRRWYLIGQSKAGALITNGN